MKTELNSPLLPFCDEQGGFGYERGEEAGVATRGVVEVVVEDVVEEVVDSAVEDVVDSIVEELVEGVVEDLVDEAVDRVEDLVEVEVRDVEAYNVRRLEDVRVVVERPEVRRDGVLDVKEDGLPQSPYRGLHFFPQ